MTSDIAGINAQARDISFLIDYANALPNTDTSAVAVAGHSWGGISNLFAAARDSRITALIALDGSLRYFPGLVKQANDVHPEQMRVPLLYFAEAEWSLEDQERYTTAPEREGPNVLNAWTHGDLWLVHMLDLNHYEFGSMFQRNEDRRRETQQWRIPGLTREDAITGYAWMARYTLRFLDAYLKRDGAAMAFLKKTPVENGVPAAHVMSVRYRSAD
jgi:pimeloyl-ACP methyl ester carboxylesterase